MPDDGRVMAKTRTTTCPAPLPVLRAAVFALVGTVLGISAHHLVAEGPVPWRQSVPAVVVLFAVGLVGTRRPRPLATVVATCGAAQAGLHLWLMTDHPEGSASAMAAAVPAHLHHGMDADAAWHGRTHDSPAMTAVHAVAAVLVALLLHRADSACWSLARGLTSAVEAARARIVTAWRLLTRRTAPPEAGLLPSGHAWLERPPLKGAVLADVVLRRGPPRAGLTHAN
ncbi:hypothetical protein AB0I00_26445 [Streptomyces sp. NPDC050803]|uniref:hypothetical protein n=1 Tax=unclassified Streptomyces TaxID=2593676 RepID=UPI003414C130